MTYYTRELNSNNLCAMVNARSYSEALSKSGFDSWSCMCRHKKSSISCPVPPSGERENCISFMYLGKPYYMYHF